MKISLYFLRQIKAYIYLVNLAIKPLFLSIAQEGFCCMPSSGRQQEPLCLGGSSDQRDRREIQKLTEEAPVHLSDTPG